MGTIRILEACQEFDRLFAAGQSVSDLTGVQETQLVISGQAVFLEGSTTPIPSTGLVPITSVQFRYPNGFGFQLEGPRQYLFRGEVYEGNGTGFTKVSGFVDPGSGGGGGGGGGGDASAANQLTQIARAEAIRDRLPAALGPQAAAASLSMVSAPTDPIGNGTREYNFAQATRTAIASTSSAAIAIGTLGASREVMLVASSRCFVKFGGAGVTAAEATDLNVLALPADAMFHLRIPAGVTHFRVIRDTADGFLRCIPVA